MDKQAYEEYLTTAIWKARRNRRLRQARWRCERCGENRALQVHHRTYDRLGAEWDQDLEVLCRNCHEQHHLVALHDAPNGRLFVKVASVIIREHPTANFADLSAMLKERCVALKIPYNVAAGDRALSLLSGSNRMSPPIPQTAREMGAVLEQGRPLTDTECRETLKRLGFASLVKSMPRAGASTIDIYGPVPSEDFGDHDRY